MKKLVLLTGLVALLFGACGPDKKAETDTDTPYLNPNLFSYTVTEETSLSGKLPPLQSFVFGTYNNYWIIFSGRTNGFHGFVGSSQYFPQTSANEFIYVYDTTNGTLYMKNATFFGGDTGNVFRSTNLPHTQQGVNLYACGGYGVTNATDTSANKTYSYFMKINMANLVNAVMSTSADSSNLIRQAIQWTSSSLVQNTGGELYILNNTFYLAEGHNFTGIYGKPNVVQIYQDKVNVFTLDSTAGLSIVGGTAITDGLPDSTTQFRRRDLVVAPCVQSDGSSIGLSIYGGVFTLTNGTPFTHPIYINPSSNPQYRVDTSNQYANIYSAAFLTMYDANSKCMMTSIFGGLGYHAADTSNGPYWTSHITNVRRSYANNSDLTTYETNPNDSMPTFIGGEAVFIPSKQLTYFNADYKIVDYTKLSQSQFVGYIYGGIVSTNPNNNSGTATSPSTKVYRVTLNKLLSSEAPK
jgi:hypothetical protein